MHHDEATRQRTLDTYRLVDSLPDEAYDDIVKLAARLCDAPTALVTLIDRDRQLFKAKLGFEPHQTRRDEAFCDHAIRRPDEMMEVADASVDPRFADNVLVTGETAVRFYAGMPLVTPGGFPMGTVCVLDTRPRTLAPSQREALSTLARLTMNLFESHHRERELRRALVFAGSPMADNPALPRPDAPESLSEAEGSAITVVIVQVQSLDVAVASFGERAVARQLSELDARLAACLQPGDCIDRATNSGEAILLLRGPDASARLQHLGEQVARFEADFGLRTLSSRAVATAGERLESVFMRADAALSDLKDQAVAD